MGWIAAVKKPENTAKQSCDRCDARVAARVTERECFYWPEECEIVCRSGFANVDIVFLICLMFIFERPIQITLFRIHLVSVIKCVTCQVRFWINYWRVWLDKQRQHSLRYLPDFTQQYFSSISAAEVMLITWPRPKAGGRVLNPARFVFCFVDVVFCCSFANRHSWGVDWLQVGNLETLIGSHALYSDHVSFFSVD